MIRSFAVAIIENHNIVESPIPLEDIALDKLPVSDGKRVLTSRLKYFHKAISPPGVQQKTS